MKPIRLISAAFLMLLALSLAACQGNHRTNILPAQPVISAEDDGRSYYARNLEAAVGSDGSHHLVYMEEETGGAHRLVYAYQKFAEAPSLLVIPPPAPHTTAYLNPDIAVTSSGRVYLVWQAFSATTYNFYNCYASFMPTETTPPTCTNLDAGGGYGFAYETEPPVLVSEGNTVWAVYSVETLGEPRHQLKAVRLSPTVTTPVILHDVVVADTPVEYNRPALAIEDNGILHAVYTLLDLTGNIDEAHYARVTASGAGDVKPIRTLPSTRRFEEPAIAIEHIGQAPDNVYYLLNHNPRSFDGTSSVFLVYAHSSDATALPAPILPLPAGGMFSVPGSPSLVIEGGVPMAYFAGSSAGVTAEVYGVPLDRADSDFFVLEPTSFVDCAPRAVVAEKPNPNDPFSPLYSPVVIWRECSGFTVQDLYVYDEASADAFWQLRKAADQGDANPNRDYDLAVHGESVFGAWIDTVSAEDHRLVPWISTNTYQTTVPVILK